MKPITRRTARLVRTERRRSPRRLRGPEQRREHPQGRGLPSAVRADEPEDLARFDVQVDAGHRDRPS